MIIKKTTNIYRLDPKTREQLSHIAGFEHSFLNTERDETGAYHSKDGDICLYVNGKGYFFYYHSKACHSLEELVKWNRHTQLITKKVIDLLGVQEVVEE